MLTGSSPQTVQDELRQIDAPVTIRNMVASAYMGWSTWETPPRPLLPTGEFNLVTDKTTQIERMMTGIEALVTHAANVHKADNCIPGSNELKPDNKNNITRLITNEFAFYTQKPLSMQEFEGLQNLMTILAKQQPENLHLVLGSFAVRTADNRIMNVAAHIECGKEPKVNLIVKNYWSQLDPVFVDEDANGVKGMLLNMDVRQNVPPPPPFTFNNVIECKTAGNARFLTCIDICLDHMAGVAKKNVTDILDSAVKGSEAGTNDKVIPKSCSHVVTSCSTQRVPANELTPIAHCDPQWSSTYPNESFKGYLTPIFGTAFGVFTKSPEVCQPLPKELLEKRNKHIENIEKNQEKAALARKQKAPSADKGSMLQQLERKLNESNKGLPSPSAAPSNPEVHTAPTTLVTGFGNFRQQAKVTSVGTPSDTSTLQSKKNLGTPR